MTDEQQFLIDLILRLENQGEEAISRDDVRRVGKIGKSLGKLRQDHEPYDVYVIRLERETDAVNRRAMQ